MSFLPTLLHPALLWFLPLAAIPLILHLLTLHRLKTVELSTFRFLFDSYVQQRRRMRFLEALLAMLRTLFLLLLIVLFLRPVLRSWGELFGAESGAGREVILLVDCSASMNARSAGLSSFERAKKAAASVVERLGRDDRLTLIRIAGTPEELFSRFTTDTQGIQDRIDSLKTSPSRGNIFAALLQVFGPEAPKRTNPLVYLITDCQSSGWKEVRSQGPEGLIPRGTPFVVINVGDKQPLPNRAVVGTAPRHNRVIAGLPIILRPQVVNYSRTEPAELVLSVFLDGKETARMPLTLKPGETMTRQVYYLPREPGIVQGRFKISGSSDRFPDDDEMQLTLLVQPRVKVLVVNNVGEENVGHVGPDADEGLFVVTALKSKAEAPADDKKASPPTGTKDFQRSLDVQRVAEAALNEPMLHDASVVVLANCGSLNNQQLDALRRFVRNGGGLLIFPGDKVNPAVYNDRLFPVPGPQGESLTAARLGQPVGNPEERNSFEQLTSIDVSHPALSVFSNGDSDARPFKTTHVYRHFPLQLPKQRGNAWPLMRFSSGSPALVESRLGDGTVLLSAFPAQRRWTDLPLRPDFVPLLLRLASHVRHRPEVEVSSVVPADGIAEVTVNNLWSSAEATVKGPAGHLLHLPLERSGARLLGAFERTAQRGFYEVDVRGSYLGQPRAATLAFAVNLAPEESDFTMLDEKGLRGLMPGVDLTYVDASAEAQHERGAFGKEREVWPILIWGVFLIMAIEFLFATTRGRRSDGEEQTSLRERIVRMSPGSWVARMTGAGAHEGTDS